MKGILKGAACATFLLTGLASIATAHDGEHGHGSKAVAIDPYFKDLRQVYKAGEPRWWKGNTHTHTWWSDGDSPAEVAAAWYRERGYNFLVLSDHNRMQEHAIARGSKALFYTQWYPIDDEPRAKALDIYRRHFGSDWVQEREVNGLKEVKLRTLDEFRHLFEAPNEFMFIRGEEITDMFQQHPVHINAVNNERLIEPRGGETPTEIIQNTLNAVIEDGKRSGREVFAHLNHPNFKYALTIEDLVPLQYRTGEGFFELYNGHHGVENYGDELRPGIERMWDVILAKRIAEGDGSLLYGIATDDAHSFARWEVGGQANPGRGWIMTRATRLTPDFIAKAIKQGDFYASTGVTMRDIKRAGNALELSIEPEPGVEYTIEFIGTRRGVDLRGRETRSLPAETTGRASQTYSPDIGIVLKTIKGITARYEARGDELYVRARITSTRLHPNPFKEGDLQMAWTQPLKIERKR